MINKICLNKILLLQYQDTKFRISLINQNYISIQVLILVVFMARQETKMDFKKRYILIVFDTHNSERPTSIKVCDIIQSNLNSPQTLQSEKHISDKKSRSINTI